MDKTTSDIRRSNWLRIMRDCQQRPEGMTVKQWLKENGITDKGYYYWLRKFRKEAAEKMQNQLAVSSMTSAPVVPIGNESVTFLEIPSTPAAPGSMTSNAAIRIGGATIELSESISDEFLLRILKAVSHVG